MLDLQIGDSVLQSVRQRLVDRIHAAERGVAAGGRHLQRVEHARHRRHIEIGHVGMPDRLAGAEAADRLAVHHHVGDDVDFRQAFDEAPAGFLDRRPVEVAEAAAERDQVLVARASGRAPAGPDGRARRASIAANCVASRCLRSTPRISAPSAAPVAITSIGSARRPRGPRCHCRCLKPSELSRCLRRSGEDYHHSESVERRSAITPLCGASLDA